MDRETWGSRIEAHVSIYGNNRTMIERHHAPGNALPSKSGRESGNPGVREGGREGGMDAFVFTSCASIVAITRLVAASISLTLA